MKLYSVKPESVYGEDADAKRVKQQLILDGMNLTVTKHGYVICDADQALNLVMAEYCGKYLYATDVEILCEVKQDQYDIASLLQIVADKSVEVATEKFNTKCQQEQPGLGLIDVTETKLVQDCCTEVLQEDISQGWRILAIQPQPDQRRPDYILGRVYLPNRTQ